MTVQCVFRCGVLHLRFPYVNHRPVLLRSEHSWHQLQRPVSHCHFLYPGFWVLEMIPFNLSQIHSLVSKLKLLFLLLIIWFILSLREKHIN